MRQLFPFTAIVGQEKMRRALILNAINPQIGGVLVRGERGTAKATAAPRTIGLGTLYFLTFAVSSGRIMIVYLFFFTVQTLPWEAC